jgi:UDP:flavonoid glycosyltransferase YjiC (YdhE family)
LGTFPAPWGETPTGACPGVHTIDFPIPDRLANLHYVGPLRNESPQEVSFPFEKLTGQPLIYASLGSLQNRKQDGF